MNNAAELQAGLSRLDGVLARALEAARAAYGDEAARDRFRGLHLSRDEIERLLDREPGAAAFQVAGPPGASSLDAGGEPSVLRQLQHTFGLSAFDLDVLFIALAPEIDLRYERVYAFLQDDVTRKRPTLDLALTLLCASAQERLLRRAHFAADAALVASGLLHLVPDPHQACPPVLAHYLKPDDQVTAYVLGVTGLDARLAPFCRVTAPSTAAGGASADPASAPTLTAHVRRAWYEGSPLTLYFHGEPGTGKRRTGEALAAMLEAPLLMADLGQAAAAGADLPALLAGVERHAALHGAIVYLDGVATVLAEPRPAACADLLRVVRRNRSILILAGAQAWPSHADAGGLEVHVVPFPPLDFGQRRERWRKELASFGGVLADEELDALADRFRLTEAQIRDAVAGARRRAWWDLGEGRLELETLLHAVRTQSSEEFHTLTRRLEPRRDWNDLVVPSDQLTQLREICDYARFRHVVYGAWGMERRASEGKGLTALFAGPPGTGKSLAAEVIAGALGLTLLRIELSQVVSKYVGETEKQFDRIFDLARRTSAMLLFDEADAVFGKRSTVKDAHDRYANIETSYLLQKMDEYDGVAVLATNLRTNMDDAFVRRLRFAVEFPLPEAPERLRIWRRHLPDTVPQADDVDLDELARRFSLAGGNIRNILVAATFLAAANGGTLRREHVLRAVGREYQKLGFAPAELEFIEAAS